MEAEHLNVSQEAGFSLPASPPRENLVRATREIGFQRADGGGMPTLTGHFAVWDQWTEIRSAVEGNFMERFAPGSMTKTLSESSPKVLFQHGRDPQIGDKVLGSVARLEPDSTGAFYEVPLYDTSYNRDLLPGLENGAYGASFRFSVMQEDVNKRPAKSDHNPRGLTERTVTEAKVMEFGPVTFPAYAGATAGVRSMTDEFLLERLMLDEATLERLADLIAARTATEAERFAVYFGTNAVPNIVVSGAPALGGNQIVANVEENTNRATEEPAEPSEAATPEPEPEPSEATTRSNRGPFWFTEPPAHLKRS